MLYHIVSYHIYHTISYHTDGLTQEDQQLVKHAAKDQQDQLQLDEHLIISSPVMTAYKLVNEHLTKLEDNLDDNNRVTPLILLHLCELSSSIISMRSSIRTFLEGVKVPNNMLAKDIAVASMEPVMEREDEDEDDDYYNNNDANTANAGASMNQNDRLDEDNKVDFGISSAARGGGQGIDRTELSTPNTPADNQGRVGN